MSLPVLEFSWFEDHHCPICGTNKGTYNLENHMCYCKRCDWVGKSIELISVEEYINRKRTELIEKMLK